MPSEVLASDQVSQRELTGQKWAEHHPSPPAATAWKPHRAAAHSLKRIKTKLKTGGMTPETQPMKGRRDKLDFISIESVCSARDAVEENRRQAAVWEEVLSTTHVQQRTHIQAALKTLNNKKTNNPIQCGQNF